MTLTNRPHQILRVMLAGLLPFLATVVQYKFVFESPPWLLLYPTVFISAWLAEIWGSVIATILSAILGLYFFIPPYQSFEISDPKYIQSILIFTTMGIMFGFVFERLRRSQAAMKILVEHTNHNDQERLALALASSHAGLWEWDLASNHVTWSDTLRQLYGVGPSLPSSYENWASTVHADDLADVEVKLTDAVKHFREFSLEWRVANCPEDQPRWLLSNGKPVRDAQGEIQFYRGIVLDVTERRQHEQALHDSERDFRLLAEAMPQIVWITRPDGWNIFLNQQWVKYTGLSLEESYGHGWIIPFHPEDQQIAWNAWQKAVNDQSTYSLEARLLSHDGECRWWLIRGVPVRDEQGVIQKWFGTCTDIHDLKQTELALKESEQRYHQLFEANPLPLWIYDAQTYAILDANQAAIACYGFRLDEFQSMTCDYLESSESTIPQSLQQTNNIPVVRQHRRKDGSSIWVELTRHELQLGDRRIGISLTRDISAQLLAEQKLQESEARWQFALEGSDQGVWDWNIVSGEVFFSRLWKSMLGFDDTEITNSFEEWRSRIHPEDLDGVLADVERYFSGETAIYQVEHRLKHRDGSYRWILARGMVIERDQDGKPARMIGIHQDITATKKIEQKLLLQSSALNAAANAILITDATGVIEWVNPAFLSLTGLSTTESIGGRLDDLLLVDTSSQENFQQMLTSIKQGKLWQGELVNRRRDGSFYTVEHTITPVFDDKQQLQHFVAIKQDISQRKRNELELTRHRYHLQELIQERTTELDQARMEAERLSLIKTSFLANMSHEIRTPMNAVLGFCHLLQQRPLDKDSLALVEKIHNAGNSLLNIINDILDFSKIEAGKIDIEMAPFHLPELLDELAALMMTIAGNKRLELIITPPKNVDCMLGDKQHLQQVLINLLANAIKFTDQGEVELRIDLSYAENNQENLRFAVRDTGIGIPYEKQAEIFSLFTQADSSITRRFGGSGLGLAISRQLVELMGGTLKLSSVEGEGSEFSFELPLQRASSLEMTSGQLLALNVLVADDSAIARAALTNIIQSLGWQADAVASGDDALSHWLAQRNDDNGYDVVLLDWQMPDPDGLATARLMREALANHEGQSTRAPIIIMITAAEREAISARPEAKFVDEILSKPLTASTLYNTVAELIGENRFNPHPQAANLQINQRLSVPGLRVLVVDDSEINREVAQLLLSGYGAIVNLADNGQEAVNWMNANPESVDIILMDVQMPVLDGYSATRILRKDPRWQNLPIVALSAGVFKEDVEMARAAGMNDFISKPFNIDQLLTTIQRLVGNESNLNTLDSAKRATEFPPTAQLTDEISAADFSKMANEWGNAEVYRRYLRQFVENYAAGGDSIANLIADDNQSGAAALTHKLKGAASSLGLKKVAAQAQIVEGMFRQDGFNAAAIESLQSTIDQACVAITDWLTDQAAAQTKDANLPSSTTNTQVLIELLQQLLQALDQDNPTIAKPVLSKLRDIMPQTLFGNIQAQLALYDFRAAESLTLAALKDIQANTNQT